MKQPQPRYEARTLAAMRLQREPWMPTPAELDLDPELATLASLDAAVEAAQASLLSMVHVLNHPEPDRIRHVAERPAYWTARTILLLGDLLRDHLRYYRYLLRHDSGR